MIKNDKESTVNLQRQRSVNASPPHKDRLTHMQLSADLQPPALLR